MKAILVAAVLAFLLHPASSIAGQNCGGYGGTECPGADSGPGQKNPGGSGDAPADRPSNVKDDCTKGGYGVADCPGYSSKSSSGASTTDEEAAKKLQGCGGYGTNDCPKSNQPKP